MTFLLHEVIPSAYPFAAKISSSATGSTPGNMACSFLCFKTVAMSLETGSVLSSRLAFEQTTKRLSHYLATLLAVHPAPVSAVGDSDIGTASGCGSDGGSLRGDVGDRGSWWKS